MARMQDHLAEIDGRFMMSSALAAAIANVTEATFSNWLKDTNEMPPPRADSGWIPAREFGEWTRRQQILRRGRGGAGYPWAPEGWGPLASVRPVNPDGPDPLDKAAADVRLKTAQAEKIERENLEAAGLLVPADQIEEAWKVILDRVRLRLLKIPSSTAMVVVGEVNPHVVQEKLESAIRDALSELSESWRDEVADDD